MPLMEEEIRRLTPEIWNAILSRPLELDSSADVAGASSDPHAVSACVHITGAWNGAVALSCDLDFATEAAAIMFELNDVAPTRTDIQDALGELTNMIGGNVKALLPEPCQLSLPAVGDGAVRIVRSRLVSRVPFRSGTHRLNVSLHEREACAA